MYVYISLRKNKTSHMFTVECFFVLMEFLSFLPGKFKCSLLNAFLS